MTAFRLNRIGFVTFSCVNVAFLFEVTLPQFRKKPVKVFNALLKFISINVVSFQFFQFHQKCNKRHETFSQHYHDDC